MSQKPGTRFFSAEMDAFATAVGVWFWEQDAEHRLTYVSESITALTGHTPEEFVGRPREEIADLADPAGNDLARMRELMDARQPFRDMRYSFNVEAGTKRWFKISGAPRFGEDGAFLGYWGIGQEISAQVILERVTRALGEDMLGVEGDAFFAAAAAAIARLARAERTQISVVEDRSPLRMRTLAAYVDGRPAADTPGVLDLEATPCAEVVRAGAPVIIQPDLEDRYPDDPRVAGRHCRVYAGCPLINATGETIGTVAYWRKAPLIHTETIRQALQTFALYISAEYERVKSVRVTQESEARFRNFFDNLPGQAYIKDADLCFQWVNKNFSVLSGRPPEYYIGKRTTETLGATPGAEALEAQDRKVLQTGAVADRELHLVDKEGREAWLRSVKFPLRDASGGVSAVGGINLDISERVSAERERDQAIQHLEQRVAERTAELQAEIVERKRIEQEIRNSEAAIRDLLENCSVGVVIVTTRPFGRLYENRRARELLLGDASACLDDLRGRQSFVNPADYDALMRRVVSGEEIRSEVFERIRPNTGERWWSLLDAAPIRFADKDAVIVWAHDITERIEAAAAVQRSEQRLRDILETSTAGISVARVAPFKRIFANRRLLEMFEVETLEELETFGFRNTLAEPDRDAPRTEVIRRDPDRQYLRERIRPNGSRFWTMVTAREIEFEGAPALIFWTYDITEQKQIEQDLRDTLERLRLAQEELVQSERLASLGEMVAGMAHEINTPIGVGLTAVSVIERETEKLQEAGSGGALTRQAFDATLQAIEEGASMALANLSQAARLVRSFKQIAIDQSSEQTRRLNLRAYVEEIVASLTPATRDRLQPIEVGGDAELEIESAPGAIAQIVTNLVMNSVMHGYADGRSGRVTIAVERDGDKARLSYVDDGDGMAPDVLRRIFEPFFTTKRGQGGSGLGMSIVYNLVTNTLQGKIRCNSAPGEGFRAEVQLPVA